MYVHPPKTWQILDFDPISISSEEWPAIKSYALIDTGPDSYATDDLAAARKFLVLCLIRKHHNRFTAMVGVAQLFRWNLEISHGTLEAVLDLFQIVGTTIGPLDGFKSPKPPWG